ncbi:MAG: PaaI family thioesterase [Parvularculaceae bacterium]
MSRSSEISFGEGLSPNFMKMLEGLRHFVESEHILFKKLGLQATLFGVGEASFDLTADNSFTDGDLIHGGVFTILLDTIMSISVMTRLEAMQTMATINLKTDYPGAAKANARLSCTAICHAIRDDVAFTSGRAIDKQTGELIALAEATFMVGTRSKPKASRI